MTLEETIIKLVPVALAGAFLPTWTRDVIILLGTNRPHSNALSYIGGNAVVRLAIGALVLYGVDAATLAAALAGGESVFPWYVAALSALLLAGLGVWLVTRRLGTPDETPRWLRWFEELHPSVCFALGAGMMAMPGTQYVYYLSGMAVIAGSGLGTPTEVVLTLAFTFFLELMLLTPVVLYSVSRTHADRALTAFKRWLGVWGLRVSGAILLAVAAGLGVVAYRSYGT